LAFKTWRFAHGGRNGRAVVNAIACAAAAQAEEASVGGGASEAALLARRKLEGGVEWLWVRESASHASASGSSKSSLASAAHFRVVAEVWAAVRSAGGLPDAATDAYAVLARAVESHRSVSASESKDRAFVQAILSGAELYTRKESY